MKISKITLFALGFLFSIIGMQVQAKPNINYFKFSHSNLDSLADEPNKQLIEKLSRANLEGELYLQDTENNVLDLGSLRLSGKIEKEIFTKKLMKQEFFLTNEGVVQDGKTFLAIVNTTTISEPDRTQYLYFINVAVIPIGFFVIKNITTDTITIEMEKEDGTKEEGLLRKKVGTFLSY